MLFIMFDKVNCRTQLKMHLILHLILLANHCIALLSDKATDLYSYKYDDLYNEDKLQNIVWMNIFGSYPTLNSDNFKNRMPNLTQIYSDKNNDNYKQSANDPDKLKLEEKSVVTNEKQKLLNKFDLSPASNTEKTILDIVEDSPLYQLCLRTINVVETCLALILKSGNTRKMSGKQHVCANLPTWLEFRQCLQQFQSENDNFSKFLEKNNLMAVVKKNTKITDTPKRLPFHAWGGKRFNQVGTEKVQTSRVPFNAWGGKRQDYDQAFNSFMESCEPCKRSKAKFHSWGGKRSKRKTSV